MFNQAQFRVTHSFQHTLVFCAFKAIKQVSEPSLLCRSDQDLHYGAIKDVRGDGAIRQEIEFNEQCNWTCVTLSRQAMTIAQTVNTLTRLG